MFLKNWFCLALRSSIQSPNYLSNCPSVWREFILLMPHFRSCLMDLLGHTFSASNILDQNILYKEKNWAQYSLFFILFSSSIWFRFLFDWKDIWLKMMMAECNERMRQWKKKYQPIIYDNRTNTSFLYLITIHTWT